MSEGIFIQYQKGFVSAGVWGEFDRMMLGLLQAEPTQEFWHGGNFPFSDADIKVTVSHNLVQGTIRECDEAKPCYAHRRLKQP